MTVFHVVHRSNQFACHYSHESSSFYCPNVSDLLILGRAHEFSKGDPNAGAEQPQRSTLACALRLLFARAACRSPALFFVHNDLTKQAYNRNRFFLWGRYCTGANRIGMADKTFETLYFRERLRPDPHLQRFRLRARRTGRYSHRGEFERKAKGMAKINLVQQGAELAYLLLHDPEFKAKVRKEHLREVGKRIRLKKRHQAAVSASPTQESTAISSTLRSFGGSGRSHPLGAGGYRSSRSHLWYRVSL